MALAQIKKAVINRETLDAEKKNAMAILSHVLKNVIDLLHPVMPFITELGGLESIAVGVKAAKPKFSASAVVPGGELFIPLEGILDPAAEIARLEKEIEKAKAFAASIEKKLSNEKFVSGAPEAVVNAERTKLATQQDIIAKCQKALEELR